MSEEHLHAYQRRRRPSSMAAPAIDFNTVSWGIRTARRAHASCIPMYCYAEPAECQRGLQKSPVSRVQCGDPWRSLCCGRWAICGGCVRGLSPSPARRRALYTSRRKRGWTSRVQEPRDVDLYPPERARSRSRHGTLDHLTPPTAPVASEASSTPQTLTRRAPMCPGRARRESCAPTTPSIRNHTGPHGGRRNHSAA